MGITLKHVARAGADELIDWPDGVDAVNVYVRNLEGDEVYMATVTERGTAQYTDPLRHLQSQFKCFEAQVGRTFATYMERIDTLSSRLDEVYGRVFGADQDYD